MYAYEQDLISRGISPIAGIDEAGRGPLAGPVVAAAVILPDTPIPGLNDSKKLSPKKRESLFRSLLLSAHIGVGIVDHAMIDRLNIHAASKYAMVLAVKDLALPPRFLLVDGKNMDLALPVPQLSIIGGDGRSASIAAASIIAKVTRDRLMEQYDRIYPDYGFLKHKGYPTKDHVAALTRFGPAPIHRTSFAPVAACITQ